MILICDCGDIVLHAFAKPGVNAFAIVDTSQPQVTGHLWFQIECQKCHLVFIHVVNGLPEHDQAPDMVDSPAGPRINVLKKLPPDGTGH